MDESITLALKMQQTADEWKAEAEKLRAVLDRIHHFASGECDLSTSERLRCIAGECRATKAEGVV
jgi:hypothetical protein